MKANRQPLDFMLFLVILMLLTMGIIMVFSASFVSAQTTYGDGFYFLKRQLLFAVLGVACMIAVMRIDYRQYKKWAMPLFIVSVFLLIIVLIPGVGLKISGARRWLGVSALSFQPSEVAKLALVLFLARYLSQHQDSVKEFFKGFALPMLIVGLVCGFMLLQPDLGTAVTNLPPPTHDDGGRRPQDSHLMGLACLGDG